MACAFPSMVSSQNQSIDIRYFIPARQIIRLFPREITHIKGRCLNNRGHRPSFRTLRSVVLELCRVLRYRLITCRER
ncbi:hypothetical protein BIFPSEUDO_02443 [Bifidobacterium pseudocatenulatum DSM 20438 = JCM 1200 = LMG 10505]|uniref:Uncharacterized protein n=1 Tax=Bifidobacterium pseudocatenulatum DSM 20438 = JCM 1200 = LMG 10505 TaxID=547043 RepID=C0BQ04_BIFPS|nr:hypothetical protein BIFPSEUDO_02443 [Bifidobacterium pseudocatenulatum DSM 20438 = JCM 1200 = LMG 10505]